MNEFNRTINLIGEENFKKLSNSKVMIFGLGGVGSYVCEILARSGITNFIIIDNDIVDITNINRQLIALHSTIGKQKTTVTKERILDINPNAAVETNNEFILKDNINNLNFDNVNYIIDCVDTVTAKISIIEKAKELNIPVISSMGTGNKLEPEQFKIVDISKTSVCPLAKVMRTELKKRGITNVPVLFSTETPIKSNNVPKTISYVPSVAGILIAKYVINEIISR